MVRDLSGLRLSGWDETLTVIIKHTFFLFFSQAILKEVDESFSEDELDGIIGDVSIYKSNIRHNNFRPSGLLRLSCVTFDHPPWILKRGGLERFVQRPISLNKKMHIFFRRKNLKRNIYILGLLTWVFGVIQWYLGKIQLYFGPVQCYFEEIQWYLGDIQGYLGGKYCRILGKAVAFLGNTVVFGANTVVFWTNIVVFGSK